MDDGKTTTKPRIAIPVTRVIQKVVRTTEGFSTHNYRELQDLLDGGWSVVMCNRIGESLEYIVQKTEVSRNG